MRQHITRRGMLRLGMAGAAAVAVPVGAATASATTTTAAADPAAELDTALAALVGGYDDPARLGVAATGVVTGPNLRWRGAAGYADRTGKRLAQSGVDYRFRIGSATKSFTAVMVLQLVAEGLLRLDDPVRTHLPGVIPDDDRITVRNLLGMTSGLADFVRELFPPDQSYQEYVEVTSGPLTPSQMIQMSVEQGPRFEPGQYFEYSTTNYVVLGLLLERLTGRSYIELLHGRILGPLGLRATSLPPGPQLPEPYLRGYAHFADRTEQWTDVSTRYEHGWSGGSLVSTTADLSRFFTTLLSGRLLPPALLTEMQTLSGVARFQPGGPGPESYALGLHRFDNATCSAFWGHGGTNHGYLNFALASADGRTSVAFNVTGFPTGPDGRPNTSAFRDTALSLVCS